MNVVRWQEKKSLKDDIDTLRTVESSGNDDTDFFVARFVLSKNSLANKFNLTSHRSLRHYLRKTTKLDSMIKRSRE